MCKRSRTSKSPRSDPRGPDAGHSPTFSPRSRPATPSRPTSTHIYSLGCTLYYLLTGGPPFRGEHLWELYRAHVSMEAGPLNLVRLDVPVELAAVVAKIMPKETEKTVSDPGRGGPGTDFLL